MSEPKEKESPESKEEGEGENPEGTEGKTSEDQIKSLAEQKKHWREKAEKAEKDFAEYKQSHPQEEKPKDEPQGNSNNEVDPYALAKTVSALKDYSESEIEFIQKYAKMNNLSPQDSAKADEVKDYISYKRLKVAKENNIPDPSSPSTSVYGKNPKDIQKMSKEDHQKLEAEALRQKEGKSGV